MAQYGHLDVTGGPRAPAADRHRGRPLAPGISRRLRPDPPRDGDPSPAADVGIVEQNFDFDLLSPAKLMEKAVGETVTLVRTNPATGAETRERAKVLAVNGGVVLQIGDRIEVLRDDGLPVRVIFDRVPENLRARPTLSVTVESASGRRSPGDAQLSDAAASAGRPITSPVRRSRRERSTSRAGSRSPTPPARPSTMPTPCWSPATVGGGSRSLWRLSSRRPPGAPSRHRDADRERLGDFYLYPLPERTTIANQPDQAGQLPRRRQGAPAHRAYEYRNGWLQTSEPPRAPTPSCNSPAAREQGLGDALPAGTVRVYQKDMRGNPQFVGEKPIGHTPMGSDLA
jgi:hypothetical protein